MESNYKKLDFEIHKASIYKRVHYDKPFYFVVSCLGFAAGFGSVWRFPWLVYKNGGILFSSNSKGGAFLIPYFFLLFAFAIPVYYLEVAVG